MKLTQYISEYTMLHEVCKMLDRDTMAAKSVVEKYKNVRRLVETHKEDEKIALQYPMMMYRHMVYEAAKAADNIHEFMFILHEKGCSSWFYRNVVDRYEL